MRVVGHGDMGTKLWLNPISTRGGRLWPLYTEYLLMSHQVSKATGAPAYNLNFHKNNMYIVLNFFLQGRGFIAQMDIILFFWYKFSSNYVYVI